MQRGILQIGSDLINAEIATKPMNRGAVDALRDFWATIPADSRATLNTAIRRHVSAVRAPSDLLPNIALGYLFAGMDRLNLTAQWDAFAASVRWPAIV